MAQKDNTDRMVGLAKVMAWPLIVLVAIVIFADPIKKQFLAGNIESIKVGSLELNMRVADLPIVESREVASALAGLPETEVVALLFTEPDSSYSQCEGEGQSDFEESYAIPFDDLARRGLATVESFIDDEGATCLRLALTDAGTTARTFITDLIAAQLKTAEAQ